MANHDCTARIAVDIGGTFTDVVLEHASCLATVKVPTTPRAPEAGFMEGVHLALAQAQLTASDVSAVIHGTTLATNALIERSGASTALITTRGFRDSLEIGYESRHDQYDLFIDKPSPLIPRTRRFAVPERLSADGEVLTPLDEKTVEELVPELEAARVESVVIGFLHSYANLSHERRAGEIIHAALPNVAITLSGEVCPELREYERFSTAAANAYIQPLMSRYLQALANALRDSGFTSPLFLVTSAGTMTTLETALRFPIRLVESGPSGGAVLARDIAQKCGESRVLSYDMGGTTAKICFIEGFEPLTARQFEVARQSRFSKGSGIPVRVPVVEMIEIGAGGGSIARVDDLDRLLVGPQSAAADPGPACYARGGTLATVSDADLILGCLDPDRFAEGRIKLCETRAREAVSRDVAQRLELPVHQAAQGISDIVEESMANAARVHAVERAIDPASCTLIAFGGAGPLHVAKLAEKLDIARIIVPRHPGVGSALGFLKAPLAYQCVRSRYSTLSSLSCEAIETLFTQLTEEARQVVATGSSGAPLTQRRTVLMRYRGQGHEIEIEVPDGPINAETLRVLRERYDERYTALFGRTLPEVEIETLTWSLTLGTSRPVEPPPANDASSAAPECLATRFRIDETGQSIEVPTYWRPDLRPGAHIAGPALVVESQTTTWIPERFLMAVDALGNLIIERQRHAG